MAQVKVCAPCRMSVDVSMQFKQDPALSDQGDPSTYTLHGAYYLKDRDSRPKVWYISIVVNIFKRG